MLIGLRRCTANHTRGSTKVTVCCSRMNRLKDSRSQAPAASCTSAQPLGPTEIPKLISQQHINFSSNLQSPLFFASLEALFLPLLPFASAHTLSSSHLCDMKRSWSIVLCLVLKAVLALVYRAEGAKMTVDHDETCARSGTSERFER